MQRKISFIPQPQRHSVTKVMQLVSHKQILVLLAPPSKPFVSFFLGEIRALTEVSGSAMTNATDLAGDVAT